MTLLQLLQASSAAETSKKIDEELKELQSTLSNIEQARPFEDLTVSKLIMQGLSSDNDSGGRSRRSSSRDSKSRRDYD